MRFKLVSLDRKYPLPTQADVHQRGLNMSLWRLMVASQQSSSGGMAS